MAAAQSPHQLHFSFIYIELNYLFENHSLWLLKREGIKKGDFMKKIIIIVAVVFGLTKLTAAEKAPIDFATLIRSATPTASLFNHREIMNAYKNPLLPDFLKTDQLMSALEKYLPKQLSLTSALGKAALMASTTAVAATAAYGIYYYLSPAPKGIDYAGFYTYTPAGQRVHSPCIGIDAPINHLELTITLQKNGWRAPLTIPINAGNDNDCYAIFLAALQRDLTNEEEGITGEAAAANVALLQENQTYTFTISGNVTYQGREHRYDLQEEQVITATPVIAARDEWIENFWKKNIATRVASVWPVLPGDLINDSITTYHAVITDTNTQQQLHSLSVLHKENFKNQVIEALASEIFANAVKGVEIKISATMGKDHFALPPMILAIYVPGSEERIHQGLQRPFITPACALEAGQLTQEAAKNTYATQLWTETCEHAFNEIVAIQPLTTQEKLSNGIVWAGVAGGGGYLAIKKLTDAHLLSTAVLTFLGFATLTKMHSIYTAHKAKYH